MISRGRAVPVYGRRGRLAAIYLRGANGASPVISRLPLPPRYSYPEKLPSGYRAWTLRRIPSSTRDLFFRVVTSCMEESRAAA